MDIATILSINQTVHNVGAVLFGAGPFYVLLFLIKRRSIGEAFSPPLDHVAEGLFRTSLIIWLFAIVLQALSGATFGLISLAYEGALPEIGFVALAALSVKILGAAISFFISLYLLVSLVPKLTSAVSKQKPGVEEIAIFQKLRAKRDRFVWALLFLAFIILTGAAFLRWNI